MRFLLIVWALITTVGVVSASEMPLAFNDAFKLSITRGSAGQIHLHWQMPPGYYLYRQYLSARTLDGHVVPVTTVPGTQKDDENFGASEVYFATADADLDSVASAVLVTYQGCQDHGLCYPPARRIIDPVNLSVTEQPLFTPPVSDEPARVNAETADGSQVHRSRLTTPPSTATAHSNDIVDQFLVRGGIPLLLAAFFGFGILLAFTPCVFPLYPILAAALAREGERLTPRRGLILSGTYALALALAFAIFGAVAGWTGENLQIALQSTMTAAVIAGVFAILALSMFGLFELQLPSGMITVFSRYGRGRGGSVTSAALLGFSSAFLIGPCVTAPLAGALLYVARTGDVGLGAALLFFLGLGKGVPLIIFGTAGSQALPHAGAWMDGIKQGFGFVFFALAIWMAEPLIPGGLPLGLWALWGLSASLFLGVFDVGKGRSTPLRMGLQSLGLLLAVYAVVLVVGFAAGSTDPLQPLKIFGGRQTSAQTDPEATMTSITSASQLADRLAAGQSADKGSAVYFTAEWCVSCRSLKRNVFSQPDVAAALTSLNTIRVDLTDIGSTQRALMRELDVVGPPTLIFFDRDQRQTVNGRLIGEFNADDVLRAAAVVNMNRVASRGGT